MDRVHPLSYAAKYGLVDVPLHFFVELNRAVSGPCVLRRDNLAYRREQHLLSLKLME